MDFKQKIQAAIKEAMRSKDELRLSVLRMLSSAMHNREIEKRTKSGKSEELAEEEITASIRSEVKKRRDSIAEFEKGGRKDLVEKESSELKILDGYLPQELSDEEIEKIVKEVIGSIGEVTPKPFDKAQGRDFGRVMGEVMKKIKGQASGDRVSDIVRKVLTQ